MPVQREGDTEKTMGSNPSSPTSAEGTFKIQGLKSGRVGLLVKAPHHLDKTIPDVEVREGQVHDKVIVQLDRGNTVGGRVVDGAGKPVANAEILVRDYAQGAKEITGTTDGDGQFTIENIMANDSVEVAVSHESYSGYSSEKVRVGTADLQVVLNELGTLKGVVVTPDGQPVESFTVQPQSPNEGKDPKKRLKAQTFSPTDGSFEYHGVPGGVYTVYIRSPQYSAVTLSGVKVGEGEAVDLGQVELPVGGVVFGQVVDASTSRPIPGARVQIVQGSNRFLRADTVTGGSAANQSPLQTTDSDGRFKFTGLKSGTLSLKVSQSGYVSRNVDGVNPDLAEKSQDLLVELESGGEITGVVLDKSGKPRGGMAVYLISGDAQANQTMQTDKEGKFHFSGVPSGTFTVKAHKFGPGGTQNEQSEVNVDMSVGGSQDVILQLE